MSFWKKKPPADPRQGKRSIKGGRRSGESLNPYLTARRTWADHISSIVAQRRTWQVVGIMFGLLTLTSIGGLITVARQSRFVPYVVQVDRFGQTMAAGVVTPTTAVDPRVIRAAVSEWIENARLITPDIGVLRRAVTLVYARIAKGDPAFTRITEYWGAKPESSPIARAQTEIVSTEIRSILQQSAETWQVEWDETTRDKDGTPRGRPVVWRAILTVYIGEPSQQPTDDQMRLNPLNIFIRDFSWQRVQGEGTK